MQPLVTLKQFIAVLLLLVIPAALLVAYFRNYNPELAGQHHHGVSSEQGRDGLTDEEDEKQKVPIQKGSQLEALHKQVEASQKQFEASRMQFESSRKALETLTSGKEAEKSSEIAPQGETTGTMQQEQSSSNHHMHKH